MCALVTGVQTCALPICLVEQGANPHLVFAGDGVNVFAVFPYHGMEGVRLRIRRTRPDDESELRDVVTSRREVVAGFRTLARDTAAHPGLIAHWFVLGADSAQAYVRWAQACIHALAAGVTRLLATGTPAR